MNIDHRPDHRAGAVRPAPVPAAAAAAAAAGRARRAGPRLGRRTRSDWGEPVIVGLGLGVVLPVIALVVGTGVLGSEIDDGTIAHILAKPLPRSEIVLSKLAVAAGISDRGRRVPMFVVGLIAESAALGARPGRRLRGRLAGVLARCSWR